MIYYEPTCLTWIYLKEECDLNSDDKIANQLIDYLTAYKILGQKVLKEKVLLLENYENPIDSTTIIVIDV